MGSVLCVDFCDDRVLFHLREHFYKTTIVRVVLYGA